MKTKTLYTLAYLLVLGCYLGLLYLVGVIVSLDFNPTHWHWAMRLLLTIPGAIGFFRLTIFWIKNIS